MAMKKLLQFLGFDFCYICGKSVWLPLKRRKTIRISEDTDDIMGFKAPACEKHSQEWIDSLM